MICELSYTGMDQHKYCMLAVLINHIWPEIGTNQSTERVYHVH